MSVLPESENKIAVGTAPADRRTTAEDLFADVLWKDETTGFITCPGVDSHTGKQGPKDCWIKIDGVPTVHCVHQSCEEEIEKANRALRGAIGTSTQLVSTAEQKKAAAAAKAKKAHEESIKVRAKKSLPAILQTYAWPYQQIVADGENATQPEDRHAMFQAFLGLFENEDVVWIGEVDETGQPHHSVNFKNKAEWLAGEIPAGPFTCPSCFAPGSYSRCKDNVGVQRYLVVESDSMTKNDVGAIFRWLDQAVELPLRAVVDTAGKSLHGWFEYPPSDVMTELKIMLPAMGCDQKMFGASQPCRLPGGLRVDRIQKLIYSKSGGAK
jgi:hypothetical protein